MPHLLTNLKLTVLFLILPLLSQNISAQEFAGNASAFGKKGFIENKGQIIDQDNKANNEVLYLLNMPGLNVQLKKNSFSYDTYTLKAVPKEEITQGDDSLDYLADFHRIDIEFIGANPNPVVVSSEASADYLNFYTPSTPTGGVHGVKHYRKVRYKELYPFIDLEFVFSPEGNKPFEYNFILHPGADLSQVQWTYSGTENTSLKDEKIEIETIHGILRESIPYSYIKETGEAITLNYRKISENKYGLSGPVSGISGTIVVDPVPELLWAGYFGGSYVYSADLDFNKNVLFIANATADYFATKGIATTNSLQYYGNCIVKINRVDKLEWVTHLNSRAHLISGAKDHSNHIYVAGNTKDTFDIETSGRHQTTISGQDETFLMKFDSAGHKIWGTFFGGTQRDFVNALSVDKNQNIYMAGKTTSDVGISTPGVHQLYRNGLDDSYLCIFDSSGHLKKSTYFGGNSIDYINDICVNDSGFIYCIGETHSTNFNNWMATPGAYRTAPEQLEAFVVKFDTSAQRIWSTYIGGNNHDQGLQIICSENSSIYISGISTSTTGFASSKLANRDLEFLAKMNAGGNIIWTNFFGGDGTYRPMAIAFDEHDDIYVTGWTEADSFATTNALDISLDGISDAFLIKHDSSGQIIFSTYFGGSNNDAATSILIPDNSIYLLGNSRSNENLPYYSPFDNHTSHPSVLIAKMLNTSVLSNNTSLKEYSIGHYHCGSGKTSAFVNLNNSGKNLIDSVRINWELDGVVQPIIFYTGTLQTGGDTNIFLDSILLQTGSKRTIKAWASMPNGAPDSYANDDTIRFELMPGLSGTYTINKLSGDYVTLHASADDLHDFGVCGPVRFTISNDIYDENLLFTPIEGASLHNTISYAGSHRDSTLIEYRHNNFSPFATIGLNGAKHFSFSNLTIKSLDSSTAIGLWLRNNADSNSFRNLNVVLPYECAPNNGISINISSEPSHHRYGPTVAGGYGRTGGNYNSFDTILFEGGNCHLLLRHENDSSEYAEGNSFSNIYLLSDKVKEGRVLIGQQRSLKINNSLFENTYMRISYADLLAVSSNHFKKSVLYMDYINSLKRDTLFGSSITNNFFFSNKLGNAINTHETMDVNIYYNTFSNDGTYCINGDKSDLGLVNNIFYTTKNAHSFSQSMIEADYNIYHRTDSVLGNFTSVPTNESNSLILDPLFITDSTVEISRYVPGMPLGLQSDIFGRTRCMSAPAIGAYEPVIWTFTQPQISQNRSAFVNFPVEFSHNTDTLPGTEFQWLLDGSFLSDSITLVHSFSDTGSFSLQLVVKSCLKTDTVTYSVNVLPANPLISLLGKNPDSLAVFNTYLDSGAVAVDIWGQNITHLIQKTSNLDTAVLGTYTITYLAIDSVGNRDSVTRAITVFDSIAPQISLIGNDTLFIDVSASINDPGATATDNYDKAVVVTTDSSAVDKNKTGFWPIVYTATDSSGNSAQITRWIKVQDTIIPTAQLLGPDTLIMEVHTSFNDPGINITDNYCQSGMTWTRTSDPDTALLGDYLIEYNITDCEGNIGLPIYRMVWVRDQTAPVISLTGNSTVQHDRWTTYQDAGAQLSDNYYSPVILQDSLKTHTDLDENAEGTYTFCYDLTDPSGNKATTLCRTIQVKENPNAINSPNKLGAKLYPNPNKGEFVLELYQAAGDNTYITLTDMAGREIYHRQLISGSLVHNIQLEGVSSGSYILNLMSTEGKVSFRVEVLR